MFEIISILWPVFNLFLIPFIIFASLIAILVTLGIVRNEKIIKWYLELKLPNPQMDHMTDQNKFNKLIEKWTNYNIVVTSLKFQIVILIGGLLFSSFSRLIKIDWSQDWTIGIPIAGILFIVEIFIATDLLKKKISLLLKIKEDSFILGFVSIFLTSIPFWIVSLYIIFNNTELNFNTFVSAFNTLIPIFLILTLGMYESTKEIISFFFPIPANGIYSIDDIIKEHPPVP